MDKQPRRPDLFQAFPELVANLPWFDLGTLPTPIQRLDQLGLDHGELSNASKHIIVDGNDNPYLIDFETSSIKRKVSNVTCVCQYLLLGSQTADKIKDKIGKLNKKEIINKLRIYKQNKTRENFENIIEQIEP